MNKHANVDNALYSVLIPSAALVPGFIESSIDEWYEPTVTKRKLTFS
jgi:hypothetical protein